MDVQTRPPNHDRAPAFDAHDTDELADYRSLSPLAVVSLLFGLASPLCFAAPLLMAIPIFGAVISLVALRRIAESEGALVGRSAALVGLALSVASALAAVTHTQTTRYLRMAQAQRVAHQWFDLLQRGEVELAFELTPQGAEPPQVDPTLPPDPDAEDPFTRFLNHPVVLAVEASGPEAGVRLVETLDFVAFGQGQYRVRQRYRVPPLEAEPSAEPITLTLTLQRTRLRGDRTPRWLVTAYESDDPALGEVHSH